MTPNVTQLATVGQPITRDRWGRPLITPPDGGKPVAYTRATTIAGTLDDMYGLTQWKQRQTALGLADRPDLLTSVAAHRDDKKQLNKLCEQALEASGSSAAATTGTALHSFSEQLDRGYEPSIPAAHQADMDAYQAATADLEHLYIEQMTVHDGYRIAGTPDRVVRWNGNHYIADLKTGSIDFGKQKIAAQLAIYANSVGYDPATGNRFDLPDIDRRNALIIHLPAGTGVCTLHWINIAAGWEAVALAMQVRDWRTCKGLTVPFNP